MERLDADREAMVERQLVRRGITDKAVLEAMRKVPRHLFVPEAHRDLAYEDSPLPIGAGQTISQPYIVALMAQLLKLHRGDKVLEIGSGCGYAAAVLSEIAGEVYAIEYVDALVRQARENLATAGCKRIHMRSGDGSGGWPEAAPFDAILVSAGAKKLPEELIWQLNTGGRMVVPVGRTEAVQSLLRITRTGERDYSTEDHGGVRFVPLVSGTDN